MTLDHSSPKALYLQLYDTLTDSIRRGAFNPGDAFPSESELVETYHVSRVTVRKALALMVQDGALIRRKGRGTFVASPAFVESPRANGSFTLSCKERGVRPDTKLVSRKVVWASRSVATQLNLKEGESVICAERLRLINDVPAIIETDYFPQEMAFLMEANLVDDPILEVIFEGTGRMGHRHFDTFEVRFSGPTASRLLSVPERSALLGVNMTVYDEQDAPLYYNEQLVRSDIYKYAIGN